MPSFGSRWRGVPSKSVPGHIPWRSGSPQLVLGGVQALTAAVVPVFGEAAAAIQRQKEWSSHRRQPGEMMTFGNPRRAMGTDMRTKRTFLLLLRLGSGSG